MGRVSPHAVSRWSRSPGCCGFISWCVLGAAGFFRGFFFFVFFISNAHGLLQVRVHLASCTSLLLSLVSPPCAHIIIELAPLAAKQYKREQAGFH